MNQRLIVGVDPHRKKNVMQLMDSQGQVVGPPLGVANNRPGTASFVEYLVGQIQQGEYERVQIATEAIGPVFAAGLISEIGPLERFEFNRAKVAKFAGLMWRQSQSDEFQAEHTPLIRNCNRYLRYCFCEAANAFRMRDAEYQA